MQPTASWNRHSRSLRCLWERERSSDHYYCKLPLARGSFPARSSDSSLPSPQGLGETWSKGKGSREGGGHGILELRLGALGGVRLLSLFPPASSQGTPRGCRDPPRLQQTGSCCTGGLGASRPAPLGASEQETPLHPRKVRARLPGGLGPHLPLLPLPELTPWVPPYCCRELRMRNSMPTARQKGQKPGARPEGCSHGTTTPASTWRARRHREYAAAAAFLYREAGARARHRLGSTTESRFHFRRSADRNIIALRMRRGWAAVPQSGHRMAAASRAPPHLQYRILATGWQRLKQYIGTQRPPHLQYRLWPLDGSSLS